MHPYITQSLMTARVADRHREAAAARRARRTRLLRPAAWPAGPPAQEMIPAQDRALTR